MSESHSQQSQLARQLRGLELAADRYVQYQVGYVLEWAEEQISSVCPLTSSFLTQHGLLRSRIESFLRKVNRSNRLHTFRSDFLNWLATDPDPEIAVLAMWERQIDVDRAPHESLSEDNLSTLQNALRSIGLHVVGS
jgi:hypothetical protein